MMINSEALWQVAAAMLGGLAIGLERQWSGHAKGPNARFAGLRTFTMIGLLAGTSHRHGLGRAGRLRHQEPGRRRRHH
jgi:uncharacterized membrane protein YhiD involved in acid resistance